MVRTIDFIDKCGKVSELLGNDLPNKNLPSFIFWVSSLYNKIIKEGKKSLTQHPHVVLKFGDKKIIIDVVWQNI